MTIKTTFVILFCVFSSHYALAMEIDYKGFFNVCRQGTLSEVKRFIEKNPTLDINYQNDHGETAVVHAASYRRWTLVWYLLDDCHAKKGIKDNYGQSIFSKAADYMLAAPFKYILQKYSLSEINILCKEMPLARRIDYILFQPLDSLVNDVLMGKKDLLSTGHRGYTALHSACLSQHVPLIVELLKKGADLTIKNKKNETPYDLLNDDFTGPVISLFAVREAFNNGEYMPASAINYIFEQNAIVPDVALLIKRLYVQAKMVDNPFEMPEACIWKPVCVEACVLAHMSDTDEKRCLTRILLLPQKEKTELNIKLLLDNK